MKNVNDIVPRYAQDIKKRAAREFGNGNITKQELDHICGLLDEIIDLLGKIPTPDSEPIVGQMELKIAKAKK